MYTLNGQNAGPVSEKEIVSLLLHDALNLDSYIMSTDKPIWVKLSTVQSIMDKVHTPDMHIEYEDQGLAEYVVSDSEDGFFEPSTLYYSVSLVKMLVFTLITSGIYPLFWFFRQWIYIRYHSKTRYVPKGTLALVLFPWFILGEIENDRELNQIERSGFNSFFLATCFVLVPVVGVVFLLPVQSYINRVNEKRRMMKSTQPRVNS